MAVFGLLILTSLCIVGREALTLSECGAYATRPEYTDISVVCGTSTIELLILVCPVIYTGYNESLLVLNNIRGNPKCQGRLDTSVAPPVVRFTFPIRQGNACGSNFLTTSALGTGVFADFSNIQSINVSGIVRSQDPTLGTITYNAELKYYYSCAYPLEYLLNNTQVDVSSSSIALKDNNGSFISTLKMALFKDVNYTEALIMPPLGVELKTKIYVQVAASNLTSQYFVFLDQCYASVSPHPGNDTAFNLFVACSVDPMTTMLENGDSQRARFSFSAFRFIEQQNETISTYYLHCIIRLCEQSSCHIFKQCSKRRKRQVETTVADDITAPHILTVPIVTNAESNESEEEALSGARSDGKGASVGLGIAVAVLIVIGVAAILVAVSFYRKLKLLS